MIYILETKLLENKPIHFSLTKILGIGKYQSFLICKKLGLAYNCKLSKLTPDQTMKLIKYPNEMLAREVKDVDLKNPGFLSEILVNSLSKLIFLWSLRLYLSNLFILSKNNALLWYLS